MRSKLCFLVLLMVAWSRGHAADAPAATPVPAIQMAPPTK
jgi:hypothetical protein